VQPPRRLCVARRPRRAVASFQSDTPWVIATHGVSARPADRLDRDGFGDRCLPDSSYGSGVSEAALAHVLTIVVGHHRFDNQHSPVVIHRGAHVAYDLQPWVRLRTVAQRFDDGELGRGLNALYHSGRRNQVEHCGTRRLQPDVRGQMSLVGLGRPVSGLLLGGERTTDVVGRYQMPLPR
jgi:hypothetical protein